QYVPFSDAGLFYIYAGVESGAAEHSTELILNELRRLRETPLTDRQLHAAQQQLVGQMAINNELSLNEMQSIGKAFLNFEHVDTLEEMSRDVMAVTAADLQEVAQRYLAEEKLSYLYYK
ncbi:MAG: insulinase family protein, partial [Bacteroidales bacterium]|nr:insulinase family protein [Bacteroidales bacterium]